MVLELSPLPPRCLPRADGQVYPEEQARSERRVVSLSLYGPYVVSDVKGRCGMRVKSLSLTIQVTLKVQPQRS